MIKKFIFKNKEELFIMLIFLFFAFSYNVYRVQGDGLMYYRFLERVLQVQNPENPPHLIANAIFFQSGCSFFNAPFYLVAYLIEKLSSFHLDFNGITLRQVSINLASNLYLIFSIILSVKILRKMRFKNIILPVVSILFSTSAFSAAVIIPSFNHSVDIFVITLLLYFIIDSRDKKSHQIFWAGILYVIAVLVRYLNFILIFPIITYYLVTKEYKRFKYFLIGFASIAWIVPLLLNTYNGSVSPFINTALQNSTISKSLMQMNILPKYALKCLVHPLHGLFIWSPVTFLSFIGLTFFSRKMAKIEYLLIAIPFFYLFVLGFFSYWHAGWSFSNRYLVGFFLVYIIGLSSFQERFGSKIIILFTVYSIILFINWHLCILNSEFGTPADIVKAWVSGKSDTSVDGVVNLKVVLNRLWEYSRYKYLLNIFR
jgi:hypothetical protein